MNTICPSEDRLKSLIYEAFEELPAADTARLSRLSSRLNRQLPAPAKPRHHWLFWLLLGGSMTAAAWWGGQYWLSSDDSHVTAPTEITTPETAKSPTTVSPRTHESRQAKPGTTNKQPSPIIYRREQY